MSQFRFGCGAFALLLAALGPAAAQEAGWHYSPYRGEGDRAALGCAYGSDAATYTCLAVRCADDYSVGLHVHTSRLGGDAGRWRLDLDKESFEVEAMPDDAPYGARIEGEVAALVERLKHGAVAYLDPVSGAQVHRNGISLSGALYAINQALYYCAPRAPAAAATEVDGSTPD